MLRRVREFATDVVSWVTGFAKVSFTEILAILRQLFLARLVIDSEASIPLIHTEYILTYNTSI
jgi:hypothetical protein